ncbi:MAG: OmpA family protein [Phycisphaerae bacterium]|nr:OmpA family protein [Phycisphaerae bacterium]
MTKKIFRLMFLAGLLVLSSLSAGCGMFSGKEVNALKLENANLQGRLESTDRELERADQDIRSLESDLAQAKADYDELKASKPAVGPVPPGVTKITVSDSVLFRFAEADLTSAGKRELDSIAADIKRRYHGQRISVEGHTDSVPLGKPATVKRYGRNVWLSAHRAWAVADYLIGRGISENLVSVVGRGSSKPTGLGADRDRRVEIIVLSR